jgi:hypothetical protein
MLMHATTHHFVAVGFDDSCVIDDKTIFKLSESVLYVFEKFEAALAAYDGTQIGDVTYVLDGDGAPIVEAIRLRDGGLKAAVSAKRAASTQRGTRRSVAALRIVLTATSSASHRERVERRLGASVRFARDVLVDAITMAFESSASAGRRRRLVVAHSCADGPIASLAAACGGRVVGADFDFATIGACTFDRALFNRETHSFSFTRFAACGLTVAA